MCDIISGQFPAYLGPELTCLTGIERNDVPQPEDTIWSIPSLAVQLDIHPTPVLL